VLLNRYSESLTNNIKARNHILPRLWLTQKLFSFLEKVAFCSHPSVLWSWWRVFGKTKCFLPVPDTASYIRGWMQMVLTPNDLFSWNNKYSKYMAILLRYIHHNGFIAHLPAMHVNLLCACWYSWAVKESSSLSFCRLPISLRFTSCLLLCLKLTDAPHSGPGTHPPLPLPRWRLHSQGPHTLPFQDTRHYLLYIYQCLILLSHPLPSLLGVSYYHHGFYLLYIFIPLSWFFSRVIYSARINTRLTDSYSSPV
jgi:hypothetical protein